MDDDLTPEQKFKAEHAEWMVPRALQRGKSREEIIAELIRLDWTPEAAEAIVARCANDLRRYHASPESRTQLLVEAKNQMALGMILAVLGLFAVGAMIFLVLLGVTNFIVVSALFLVGFMVFARGYYRWRLYRGDVPGQNDADADGEI
jgi:uncharacterized membrane protein